MSADDVNNLLTVLGVTGLVAVMVFVLPWADRKICGKLKVNLHGGLSENPRADRILAIRYRLLVGGILFYVIVFSWLVIFSRSAMTNYVVHVNPFRDQIDAFQTDHGFSDVFYRFFFADKYFRHPYTNTQCLPHLNVLIHFLLFFHEG